MKPEDAQKRLHKIALYMNADRSIEAVSSPAEMRAQLREVFSRHADKPIMVHRALSALLDEIVVEQMPGYNHPVMLVLAKALRETLESVSFLTSEQFEEAAWFRASDAIMLTSTYLEGIKVASELTDVPVNSAGVTGSL